MATAYQSRANMIGTADAANIGRGFSHAQSGDPAAGHHCMKDTSMHERPNHAESVTGWRYTVIVTCKSEPTSMKSQR